ncbi:MAG: hypothetical protein SOS93_09585 [Mannheimia varigena]|nr:hypothetical protein [Mannheimia varigena]
MILVKNKLENLYLNPNNNIFKAVNFIRKKPKAIKSSLVFFLIILPILYIIKIQLDISHLVEITESQNANLTHKRNLYNSLFNAEKHKSSEHTLTSINNAIQRIAKKNKLNIDSLNWNLEQGKIVEIKIIADSRLIFNFINDLNQISYLKYHFLTLTKSTEDRKIELTTTLIVLANKE